MIYLLLVFLMTARLSVNGGRAPTLFPLSSSLDVGRSATAIWRALLFLAADTKKDVAIFRCASSPARGIRKRWNLAVDVIDRVKGVIGT